MPKPKRTTTGPRGRRRKVRKSIAVGNAYIKTSFNNTLVTLTDKEGNVIAWASAGSAGFKGSRKSTPFAAQVTAERAARAGMEHGLQKVDCLRQGTGERPGDGHPFPAGHRHRRHQRQGRDPHPP